MYKDKANLYLAQMRRWNRVKTKAVAYKGGKCNKCGGVFHPSCYDFHHLNPGDKEFTWTKLRLRSWDKITTELDKCELLCSICHRLTHLNPNLW